jgi:SNF2 family DNA or RNA helicase
VPLIDLDPAYPDRVFIQTQYVDRHQVRQLPGVAYDGLMKRWHAPLSWGTLVCLRGLFKDQLELSEEILAWSWQEYAERVEPCTYLRGLVELDDASTLLNLNDDLYPFQRVGVAFLATAKQALLIDEMGSGKTVQVVRALCELATAGQEPFPALVICPNGVKYVWEREFAKWWPEVRVKVVTGGAGERRKQLLEEADVFVVNYEAVRLHSRLAPYGSLALQRCHVCNPSLDEKTHPQRRCEWCRRELNEAPYRTVIMDEAHRLKDPHAKQTRATWSIAHGDTVRFRYGLTGTPIATNLSNLWSIMHAISKDEFPTRGAFVDRYVEKSYNFFGGMEMLGIKPDTREELFKIIDPRTRRLPKEVILPQLPPKIYSERYLEMNAKQGRAYRQMEKHMITDLENGLLVAKNPLVKVGRLMQFASAFAQLDDEGNVTLSDPSNKVDALIELLDELGDAPLVVAAASKQLIKVAALRVEKVYGPVAGLVTGDEPLAARQRAVDRFQAGELRVLLGTVDAAGEGLTMTRASHMCFLQRHWSAIKNAQMEDRIHRVGSEVHDVVEIIDLLSVDTVEERQRTVLSEKLARLEEVVRDREMLSLLLGATD